LKSAASINGRKGGHTVVETAEKFYVVMHWPKNVPCGPMTRYPYKFKTRLEAEEFKQAAQKTEPSYEYLIDELEELSKN
jgi:hypothetical protein